jgi:hypothetical protein
MIPVKLRPIGAVLAFRSHCRFVCRPRPTHAFNAELRSRSGAWFRGSCRHRVKQATNTDSQLCYYRGAAVSTTTAADARNVGTYI